MRPRTLKSAAHGHKLLIQFLGLQRNYSSGDKKVLNNLATYTVDSSNCIIIYLLLLLPD